MNPEKAPSPAQIRSEGINAIIRDGRIAQNRAQKTSSKCIIVGELCLIFYWSLASCSHKNEERKKYVRVEICMVVRVLRAINENMTKKRPNIGPILALQTKLFKRPNQWIFDYEQINNEGNRTRDQRKFISWLGFSEFTWKRLNVYL